VHVDVGMLDKAMLTETLEPRGQLSGAIDLED
jgi:hypothetical protein